MPPFLKCVSVFLSISQLYTAAVILYFNLFNTKYRIAPKKAYICIAAITLVNSVTGTLAYALLIPFGIPQFAFIVCFILNCIAMLLLTDESEGKHFFAFVFIVCYALIITTLDEVLLLAAEDIFRVHFSDLFADSAVMGFIR